MRKNGTQMKAENLDTSASTAATPVDVITESSMIQLKTKADTTPEAILYRLRHDSRMRAPMLTGIGGNMQQTARSPIQASSKEIDHQYSVTITNQPTKPITKSLVFLRRVVGGFIIISVEFLASVWNYTTFLSLARWACLSFISGRY
jgi:hypothetical protein